MGRVAGPSIQKSFFLVVALLTFVSSFNALFAQPASVQQIPAFHHTFWDNTGFGAVYDIQQDSQGYLWLQAANGIYRFDGVKFLSADEVTRGLVRNLSGIDAVLPSAKGGIWFMPHKAGLIFWKDGQVRKFSDTRCTGRLGETPDGALWIAGSSGLFRIKGDVCEEIGEKWGMAADLPSGFLVDREGTVWVKKWTGELLFLKPGSTRFQLSPYGDGATTTLSSLGEAPDGSIWLSDGHGLREVRAPGNGVVISRPAGMDHSKKDLFGAFAFFSDGSIWIATEKGARWAPRPQQWSTPDEMAASPGEDLTIAQGLSSDVVWSILIDKEDTAWMATNSGLDQMRRSPFHALKLPHVQEHQFGIAPGDSESVWIGSESLPLTHVAGDKLEVYPSVDSITCLKQDRSGVIWAASKGSNRLWRGVNGVFKQITYPYQAKQSLVALAVDRDNSLWISMREFGVFRLSNGVWSDENARLGKPKTVYGGMTDDAEGNVWFAFGHSLVEWNGEQYRTYPFPDRTPDIFGPALTASNHHIWFPTNAGIEMFSGSSFHLLRFNDSTSPGVISGIAETAEGDLWLNGFSGVIHVTSKEMNQWLHNPELSVATEHLDALDGLPGLSGETIPKPSLVTSREGKLWFATTKGIAWLDPREFGRSRNRIPPPVVISSMSATGTPYVVTQNTRLPAHTERLEFHYDALSFAVPQRVFFKYRLEPLDHEWQNAGTRREAFYNSLAPGEYRFRVLASNNDGVWNEVGASTAFVVLPAYYQTRWFQALVLLIAGCFVWMAWNLRIGIITRELRGRLNARLEERERIARELHDTLLQGMFGLALRLQASVDQLEDSHPVKTDITQALTQSDAMMMKGRERIRELRDVNLKEAGLVASLDAHGRQLQSVSAAQFQLVLEGEPRQLIAPIEEELSLIGCEAITNAFRHSGGTLIQLEIAYQWNQLRVQISDNGKGLDVSILEAGKREDHWGLPNMRERAHKMRAKFSIEPGKNGGTIVEIKVPSHIIYRVASHRSNGFWSLFKPRKKPMPFMDSED